LLTANVASTSIAPPSTVGPFELSPPPKATRPFLNRGTKARVQGKAFLITGSPHKNNLETKKAAKEKKVTGRPRFAIPICKPIGRSIGSRNTPKPTKKATNRGDNKRNIKEKAATRLYENCGQSKKGKYPMSLDFKKKLQEVSEGGRRTDATKKTLNDNIIPCTFCGRVYNDPEFRDFHWVQCLHCQLWYHEICDDACHLTGTCSQCSN